MFTGERLEACDLSIDRVEATILDLANDTPVATVRDEARLIWDYHWSPDGSELLFAMVSFNAVPAPEGYSAEFCRERVEGSEQWAVLHADGSPAETDVADPFDVIDRWYGDRVIVYTCEGERVFDERYCISGGAQAPADVSFRGQTIATTTDFQLLGYLD